MLVRGNGHEMKGGVQFWHQPLDGSTTQSWCIKLARKDKHVHIYKQQQRDACSCFHELHYTRCTWIRDRMSRWNCGFVHRSLSVSEIVYTMWQREGRPAAVAPLLVGVGWRHDSPFHIWMFSSLRSIPLPVPEGRMSPISLPSMAFQFRDEVIHILIDTELLCHSERAYRGEGKQKLINILSAHTNCLLCHYLSCCVYPINKLSGLLPHKPHYMVYSCHTCWCSVAHQWCDLENGNGIQQTLVGVAAHAANLQSMSVDEQWW